MHQDTKRGHKNFKKLSISELGKKINLFLQRMNNYTGRKQLAGQVQRIMVTALYAAWRLVTSGVLQGPTPGQVH